MTEQENMIPILAEVGHTGLEHSGGLIQEEFLTELQGRDGIRVYTQMGDNCAVVAGFLWAMESMLRGVPWTFEPREEGGSDSKFWADRLNQAKDDMEQDWDSFVAETVAGICQYGYEVREPVYKRCRGYQPKIPQLNSNHDDGLLMWRALAPRAHDTMDEWDVTDSGRINGVWQQTIMPAFDRVFLPTEKIVLFRARSRKNNPEGRSLLRGAYRSWYRLEAVENFEVIGVERDLAGLPDMQIPAKLMRPKSQLSATDLAIRNKWEKFVSYVKRNRMQGILRPSEVDEKGNATGYKFGLVTTGGRSPIDTNEIIKRLESRILITMLAEFLTMGQDNMGSHAMHSDKTSFFGRSLNALKEGVSGPISRQEVPRALRYNGERDPRVHPTLAHGDVEKPDMDSLANFIKTMKEIGFTFTTADEKWLRETGDMPKKIEGEVISIANEASGRVVKKRRGKRCAVRKIDTPTGTRYFRWVHSGNPDGRPSHIERDGSIYDWDAYSGEMPGEWEGCECVAEPVYTAEDRQAA